MFTCLESRNFIRTPTTGATNSHQRGRPLLSSFSPFFPAGGLLLSDLNSWPALKQEAEDTLAEMAEYQKELYDNWTRDNLQDIESKNLSLLTSSQVVYFEQGRDMKVSEGGKAIIFMKVLHTILLSMVWLIFFYFFI